MGPAISPPKVFSLLAPDLGRKDAGHFCSQFCFLQSKYPWPYHPVHTLKHMCTLQIRTWNHKVLSLFPLGNHTLRELESQRTPQLYHGISGEAEAQGSGLRPCHRIETGQHLPSLFWILPQVKKSEEYLLILSFCPWGSTLLWLDLG